MGRPSKYTPELVAEICERLSNGEPLAQICRGEHMPDPATVWRWKSEDNSIAQDIARARELGFDAIADETLSIADDGTNDWMERNGFDQLNGEHVQRSKLRVETRLKLLAKWCPKRYGDQLSIEHTGTVRAVLGGADA